MPPYARPTAEWLPDQLTAFRKGVAQANSGGTSYIIDPTTSAARAIIGDVSHDQAGIATGLSGWGIAVLVGSTWEKLGAAPVWHAVTFEHTWENFGGEFTTAAYSKYLGWVYLRGLVASGENGVSAFALPAKFRPAATERFISIANGSAAAFIDVRSNGLVILNVGALKEDVSLNNVAFAAAEP